MIRVIFYDFSQIHQSPRLKWTIDIQKPGYAVFSKSGLIKKRR